MKKSLSLLLGLVIPCMAFSQIITNPVFVTQDYAEDFEVIFDPTSGTGGMKDATDCYAHTGVLTTDSKTESDWKHSSTWLDNSAKYKMTKMENGSWKLVVTGGVKAYYGLKDTETATHLMFVFRDAKGTKEGKATGGEDIKYKLYSDEDIVVKIAEPISGSSIDLGEEVSIIGYASKAMDMSISIDGIQIKSVESALSIQENYIFTVAGNHEIALGGTIGDNKYADTVNVFVQKPTEEKPVPEYLQEGINYLEDGKVGLVLRAPHNKDVYVLCDQNGWIKDADYQMYRHTVTGEDTYSVKEWKRSMNAQFGKVIEKIDTIKNVAGKDSAYTRHTKEVFFWVEFKLNDPSKMMAFQYLVDDKIKIADPYTEVVLDPWNDKSIKNRLDKNLPEYPAKGDGLVSVLQYTKDEYNWQYDDFVRPKPEDMVIYELHIRDFISRGTLTEAGTINDVRGKLDYLKTLGVNVIELMPITEFDGNDSWGYNPNHYMAADKSYGTQKQYKQFIDECHKRGIAVVLDMVLNHLSGNSSLCKLYWQGSAATDENPWANKVPRHPFNVENDLNHEYEGTKIYCRRAMEYWIQEYHVDGYRMDLAKGFSQINKGTSGSSWDNKDTSRIAILEDYCDAAKRYNPDAYYILEHLGAWDEQNILANYGMLPWRNMNNAYCQAAMGFSSNSKFVDSDGKSKNGGMNDPRFVGYGESHDEERTFYKTKAFGDGNLQTDSIARIKRIPTVMAFDVLFPGPKMIWQFQEFGYDLSINYPTMKDDSRVVRKPVPWSQGYQALKYDKNPLRMEAYNTCAKVINLRTQHPEIFRQANITTSSCASTGSFASLRKMMFNYKGENPENDVDVIVLGNFSAVSDVMQSVDFPHTGTWYNYLTGETISVNRLSKAVNLKPGELLILTSKKIDDPVDDENVSTDEVAVRVYPTCVNDYVNIDANGDVKSVTVSTLSGVVVAKEVNSKEISVSHLPAGNYLMYIDVDGTVYQQKIIKY